MRALVCRSLSGPQGLQLVHDWPEPVAGPGEVLIAVKAAALNFPDVLMTRGLYQERPPLPFVPGLELSGVVLAVGEGVVRVRPGERVVAYARSALAEKVAVPQELVMPLPSALGFEQGSGFCLTYFTGYHALKQRAGLAAGETLLVLGAGGGVGTAAVELGKAMGATVIAAASSVPKLEAARRLGADHVIDYATQDLREGIKHITHGVGVDVVYDPVGGPYTEPALRSLAWKGRYLVVGFAAGEVPKVAANLVLLKGGALVGVFWGAFTQREPAVQEQNARELWAMLEAGRLRPVVGEVHSLEDGVAAFEALEQRRALGKIVVRVAEG